MTLAATRLSSRFAGPAASPGVCVRTSATSRVLSRRTAPTLSRFFR